MASGAQFTSLSSDFYAIPKAQVFFQLQGEDAFRLLGDADEITVEIAVEETERFTNEEGIRQLAKTIVTQIDATLGMTLAQLAPFVRALSLMGDLDTHTQTVATNYMMSFSNVIADGMIYQLDHIRITPASVTVQDGQVVPVPYVEGTNFKLDYDTGHIQILSKPVGADTTLEVEYDAAAILAAADVTKIGIGNNSSIRGALVIRGTNEVGPRVELRLHDVQLRPNAARNFLAEADISTVEVIGRVFRDTSQAAGFELGFERVIP